MSASLVIIEGNTERRRQLETLLEDSEIRLLIVDPIDRLQACVTEHTVGAVLIGSPPEHLSADELVQQVRERLSSVSIIRVLSPGVRGPIADAARGRDGEIPCDVDYVACGCSRAELLSAILRAIELTSLRRERETLRRTMLAASEAWALVGQSGEMARACREIEKVAQEDRSPVLITGEVGTGRELVARHLHRMSIRYAAPFVPISCLEFPTSDAEVEIFGYERPSEEDAPTVMKPGGIHLAEGGTLYLEEVGELPLPAQRRLLHCLTQSTAIVVGSSASRSCNVRVIASTSVDLEPLVQDGRFDHELNTLLQANAILIPPLRERSGDVIPLAMHFVKRFSGELNRGVSRISTEALRLLQQHDWPGNVRELQNVIERAVLLADTDALNARDIALGNGSRDDEQGVQEFRVDRLVDLEVLEELYVRHVLKHTDGNKSRAARILGISRGRLRRRIADRRRD